MTLVQLKKRFYSIPQSWDELTGRQLVALMDLFNQPISSLLDAELQMFRILTGLSKVQLWWIGAYELEDKLYLVEWVKGTNTLTKNLLPAYAGFYGPADDFNNLQVVEFIFADDKYRLYKDPEAGQDPDIEHLNHLCAILYRPGKKRYDHKLNPAGDHREDFNENLISHYASRVALWPLPVKLAILQWYEGCAARLVSSYPDVFGGGGGDAARFGQWSIMRAVAEKGNHGKMDKVEKMYLKTYMMELTEIVIEGRKIEAMTKNNKAHG